MPPQTIPALLTRLIDYAGLFPPAGLDMGPAVEEFHRRRRTGDAWMLARFVIPAGRLAELEAAAEGRLPEAGEPWTLSVLAGDDPEADRARIDAFNDRHATGTAGLARADAVEGKAASPAEVAARAPVFSGLETYFEIPHREDPAALMAALAEQGARAKIRTGAVTAEAVPSAAEVARFLRAAARAGVPFKATAGLHHPLRGEYPLTYEADSPSGTMHGYLNVFLAAALVRERDLSEAEVVDLLEERDAAAFRFSDESVRWRGHEIDRTDLARARAEFATSYGSCSFREPVDELRELHLL